MNLAAKALYGFEGRIGADGSILDLRRHSDESFVFRTLAGVAVAEEDRPVVRALRGERYRDVELMVQRACDADPRACTCSAATTSKATRR